MPDRRSIEKIAGALATNEGLVEKDWHVVRALAVIAGVHVAGVTPVFSGGTSLAKGWGLIKRFSEDIDFKVLTSGANTRATRSAYRDRVFGALSEAGFSLIGKPKSGNENRFFAASFAYETLFPAGPGQRPHLQVEFSFKPPALDPIAKPLQSLIGQADRQPPEVESFLCVDAIETAADKLSALGWRVLARDRADPEDDPTIIRHLHDLAALETHVVPSPEFKRLVEEAATADSKRGGGVAPADLATRFAAMLERLTGDKLWRQEYETYVDQVSFAPESERIVFEAAIDACRRILRALGFRT